MIVSYELLGKIQYYGTVKYESQFKASRSSVLFLQDVLYGEKDLLGGPVPHLLGVN